MKLIILIILFLITNLSFSQSYKYANFVKEKLTSKDFKGRGYIENGDRITAKFISDELSNQGLKYYDTSYYQFFDISVNNIKNAKLIIGKEKRELRLGEEFLVFGYSPNTNLIIQNKKFIRIDKKEVLDNINILNLENKIIIIDRKDIKDYEASLFIRKLNSNSIKPQLVILENYDKIPYYSGRSVFSFPIIQLKDKVFKNKIDYINLNIESEYLSKYKTQNIIAFTEGKKFEDSLFVFLAHYDHLGKIGDSVYFPGGNDNASGVALLLDLAKYYSKNPTDYSIAFVFTSAEEIGILGAEYAANNFPVELSKIKFLFNFDMVGTGSGGIALVNGKNEKRASDLIQAINSEKMYFNQIRVGEASCNSDHCPFVEKNVPGIFLFTFGCEYNEYHTIYDNGINLSFTKYIDLTNLIKEFIEKY